MKNISLVYCIASKLGKAVSEQQANQMAKHFTALELDRIYKIVSRRGSNVIGIGSKPSELTGIGTEYLAPNGQVIAKFQDGHLVLDNPMPNCDPNAVTVASVQL